MADKAEIEQAVADAIIQTVAAKSDATTNGRRFKWTLVPSNELDDSGLGLGWNAWHQALNYLATEALPRRRPYTSLQIGPLLVRDTHDKTLTALRYALTERLLVIHQKQFVPL